jgi:hypothetical protein
MDRKKVKRAFGREAERHFRGLWRHLSEAEQAGLKQLAGGGQSPAAQLERLRDCGLVEGPEDRPRLFSALFEERLKAGTYDEEQTGRPPRTHDHSSLVSAVKAGLRRPGQKALLAVVAAFLLVLLVLAGLFILPTQTAALSCNGGQQEVILEYPRYLATYDTGTMTWNLRHTAGQPLTLTLVIDLPLNQMSIDSQNRWTHHLAQQTEQGELAFHRLPPQRWFWQSNLPAIPLVTTRIATTTMPCDGDVSPILAGPIPGFKTAWAWLTGAGLLIALLTWLGSELYKRLGKQPEG